MKNVLILLLTVITTASFAQMNLADSTAQVIAYWDMGGKQSYAVSYQKIKLKDKDTTSNEIITYDVDITVKDSTAKSYLVEWFYHNYTSNSENELVKRLTAVSEDLRVLIETDELGIITGVKNWKEVGKSVRKSIGVIKKEFKSVPQLDQVFAQLETMYTTKEGIEATAIQDVLQFHNFHGGKYTLGEVLELAMQVPNVYDESNPLDSKATVLLDELNPADGNFILRSSEEVDPEQLTKTTVAYLNSMSETMGTPPMELDEIGLLSNMTTTASRIHDSGWLIYSIQTKTVGAMGTINIQERIIEIK